MPKGSGLGNRRGRGLACGRHQNQQGRGMRQGMPRSGQGRGQGQGMNRVGQDHESGVGMNRIGQGRRGMRNRSQDSSGQGAGRGMRCCHGQGHGDGHPCRQRHRVYDQTAFQADLTEEQDKPSLTKRAQELRQALDDIEQRIFQIEDK